MHYSLKSIKALLCFIITLSVSAGFVSGFCFFKLSSISQRRHCRLFIITVPPISSDITNESTPKLPLSSSNRIEIVLNESDIEESFVKGSGNGGQKINTTANRVVLVHKPTGLKASCQDARDLCTNRKWARDMLMEKLDMHYNGAQSKVAVKQANIRRRKKDAARLVYSA
ncbi:peptide chain release factor-like protein [archaeon]|nr:MAG: peptide chain release factor-like protein [archaeon]